MLGKAEQAARPRSAQFAAAELQRSTTRHAKTHNGHETPGTVLCKNVKIIRSVTGRMKLLWRQQISSASHLLSGSTFVTSNLPKNGIHFFSSNLLLLDECRVVEQVVAADGSCTSLGHAACNQFRIILYREGKIG